MYAYVCVYRVDSPPNLVVRSYVEHNRKDWVWRDGVPYDVY